MRLSLSLALATLLAGASADAGVALNDCGWLEFLTIPGVSNAPDNVHTRIYQAVYLASPGYETVVRGRSPQARFWSFAAVDALTREVANLSDVDVCPGGACDSYEAVIKSDCTGESRPCLDAGQPFSAEDPGVGATLAQGRLFYRLYLPDGDERGGVPLPTIELRASGDPTPPTVLPLDGDACATEELAAERPLRSDGQVGELLNRPSGLERPVPAPGPDPVVRRYDGVAGGQFENVENQLTGAGVPPEVAAAIEENRMRLGGGATADNGYVTIVFNTSMGNLELRAKAPTYRFQHDEAANDLGRSDGSEQTRYWSLCTTQEARPVDCLHDEEITVGPDGFFTAIIAPSCPQPGYDNCLRAGIVSVTGGAAIDTLLYRNLLAAEGFANEHGPRECPSGGDSQFCGDYALQAHYRARP